MAAPSLAKTRRLPQPSCTLIEFWGVFHEPSCALDFEELGLPRLELHDHGQPFTEAEIWEVTKHLPLDKALSPDEYTSRFYRLC
jgi:hypothetical protein